MEPSVYGFGLLLWELGLKDRKMLSEPVPAGDLRLYSAPPFGMEGTNVACLVGLVVLPLSRQQRWKKDPNQ